MKAKTKIKRPIIDLIEIHRIADNDVDLSHLGEFSKTTGPGFIDHRERSGQGNRVMQYFNPANPEYAEQDYKRMMEFENGDVSCIGIRAAAKVLIPTGDHHIILYVKSPGLWGIESDSEDGYFKEVETDELASLKDMLIALNVDISNFDALSKEAEVKYK